ncbi:SCP-like protein [Necator americanus]|uniref:SCP-like protein n=1 Tax=Necator americanus TaxID=51031 RepID=W2TJ96_NECAM|nr:SCP-like protein [Necator americanus]ETN81664.1 SCP-like protein [Necator americanus]
MRVSLNNERYRYDCELEQAAIDAVGDSCSAALAEPAKYGQNVQVYETQAVSAVATDELLKDAVKQWYQPVLYYGLRNDGNKYEDKRLYTFANIAYDRNTAIGCHHKKCGDKVVITCMYSNIVPDNATLYERGTPCTKDDDCTIYTPSTCKSSLCTAKAMIPNPSPSSTTGL